MRILLILTSIFLQINLHVPVSQAEHQRGASGKNEVAPLNGSDEKDSNVLGVPATVVLAQSGGIANLPCKVNDPGAGTITWVRARDKQILTVGATIHSIDNRFSVRHPTSTDWALHIRTVTSEDAGYYECQVTSHPVQRNFIRLEITEAYSIIPGAPELHVKQGSSLRLECQWKAATESPLYVFWYRQDRMINYDVPGVKVEVTKGASILMVNKTKPSHGGNYTCSPSNAKPAYITVHVIEEEEKPAAMHGGDRRSPSPTILASNFLVCLLAAASWRIPSFTSLYPT